MDVKKMHSQTTNLL